MASLKFVIAAAGLLSSASAGLPTPSREMGDNQLVVATTAQLAPVLRKVALELEHEHPGLDVSIAPVGSDVAMADLYTRRADIAVIGRAATDPEIKAFQWIYEYPPQAWPVLRGSVAVPGHSPSIRVLVNASNPIRSISVQQLEMAFRSERPIHWRDLGVTGPFASRPVHPIIPDSEQGSGIFIRAALLNGATLFAWDRVKEIAEPSHRGSIDDGLGASLAAAVAHDPQALALVPGGATAGTRPVPLECGPTLPCDSSGAIERTVYAYADPKPRPDARSFLLLLIDGSRTGSIDPSPYRQLPAGQAQELPRKL